VQCDEGWRRWLRNVRAFTRLPNPPVHGDRVDAVLQSNASHRRGCALFNDIGLEGRTELTPPGAGHKTIVNLGACDLHRSHHA
jgi:hypothetical protein